MTWWSQRDLLPQTVVSTCYPAAASCGSDSWCQAVNLYRSAFSTAAEGEVVFKGFGTMGLRRYDGTAKSALTSRWASALALRRTP